MGARATPILLKLQVGDDYNIDHEVGGNYTTPGVWQKINFDFSSFTSLIEAGLFYFLR